MRLLMTLIAGAVTLATAFPAPPPGPDGALLFDFEDPLCIEK